MAAYQRALELDPNNQVLLENIKKLERASRSSAEVKATGKAKKQEEKHDSKH